VSEPRDTGWARLSSVRVGAVVAIALAAGFAAWLLVRGNDDSSSSPQTTSTAEASANPFGPVAATPATLRSVSREVKHTIYWVGPRSGQIYELTRTAGGRVYVRYLPAGVEVGNKSADYTIVGTYPTPNALKVLKDVAKQPNEQSVPAPGGGIAVYAKNAPRNVYVAFPGSDEQIEVYDPSAKRALRLVTSGRVAPVG
jgi:hypothetical protein